MKQLVTGLTLVVLTFFPLGASADASQAVLPGNRAPLSGVAEPVNNGAPLDGVPDPAQNINPPPASNDGTNINSVNTQTLPNNLNTNGTVNTPNTNEDSGLSGEGRY